jgi:hypothetical protein
MVKDVNTKQSTMPRNYKQKLDVLIGRNKYLQESSNTNKDLRPVSSFENDNIEEREDPLEYSLENIVRKNSTPRKASNDHSFNKSGRMSPGKKDPDQFHFQ